MDEAAARDTLRRIPYGIYVCTTRRPDGGDHAFVLSWVSQVSFKPRLVAIGVNTAGTAHGHIETSRVFCVNLLPEDAKAVVIDFLKGPEAAAGAFGAHPYTRADATGCAVLSGAAAWFECHVHTILRPGGDHEIVVGEVVGAGTAQDGPIATHASTGFHYGG